MVRAPLPRPRSLSSPHTVSSNFVSFRSPVLRPPPSSFPHTFPCTMLRFPPSCRMLNGRRVSWIVATCLESWGFTTYVVSQYFCTRFLHRIPTQSERSQEACAEICSESTALNSLPLLLSIVPLSPRQVQRAREGGDSELCQVRQVQRAREGGNSELCQAQSSCPARVQVMPSVQGLRVTCPVFKVCVCHMPVQVYVCRHVPVMCALVTRHWLMGGSR